MPRASWLRCVSSAALLLLSATGCRTVAVDEPLSPEWEELARQPAAFAALYRLTCCGQRDLPMVVRFEPGRLAVAVSMPPAGVAWEAWFDADGGAAHNRGDRCVSPLPSDRLQLPGGVSLPVDASLWATLLAGRLPLGVVPLQGRPGWLVGRLGEGQLLARCAGQPLRCLEIRLEEEGSAGVVMRLDRHHGRVPGRIRAKAGSQWLTLELAEWQPGPAVVAPDWLSWPRCGP